MDTLSKLTILADAAKYDAACTSSGVDRGPREGSLGAASAAGCCHSFTPDGRCVTLLKVLMSNVCSYDCAYCVNRRSNPHAAATFEPAELAQLTMDFYRRNYIEGLFLSSGVLGGPDRTCERMIEVLRLLREEHRFNGYIHAKAIPGASPELLDALGRLADRISVNIELPSSGSLEALCPEKRAGTVLSPMRQIRDTMERERLLGATGPGYLGGGSHLSTVRPDLPPAPRGLPGARGGLRRRGGRKPGAPAPFAPAGQSTQLIVGASPEDDNRILKLSSSLYTTYGLKRVFFSAYMPVVEDGRLPHPETPVPLRREHRLYQADWLMRFYGFTADELVSPEAPFLDLDVDPKLAWALAHIDEFPVEVNTATKEELLRVPGIGPEGARKICRARRSHHLGFDDLERLRLTLRRARHFLTCGGKRDPRSPADPELIREKVVSDARGSRYNRTRRAAEGQLALF
ncbi:putative DNA modification/repair radical SAM protein [Caniella muris]|uniref:putative DNA modification/repair radical SAM protein n=1 Tax=Caniella muris TaxID=2941502 RepID=UPI00203FA5EF|nr:putative DNA modification/repair radical SAM protein [Caniella muris]